MTERIGPREQASHMLTARVYKPSAAEWGVHQQDFIDLATYAKKAGIIRAKSIDSWCRTKFRDADASFTTVLEDGSKIVGFITGSPGEDFLNEQSQVPIAELHTGVILPAYQGQGHFKKLMDAMEETIGTQGYTRIQSTVRIPNGLASSFKRRYEGKIAYEIEISDEYNFMVIDL